MSRAPGARCDDAHGGASGDATQNIADRGSLPLGCCMAKKMEPVDELLDALVWMRRKAKKHEPVDDLVDALVKMRRRARKKLAKRKEIKKHKGVKKRKGIKKR